MIGASSIVLLSFLVFFFTRSRDWANCKVLAVYKDRNFWPRSAREFCFLEPDMRSILEPEAGSYETEARRTFARNRHSVIFEPTCTSSEYRINQESSKQEHGLFRGYQSQRTL
jgi:hypothetical protein